MGMFSNSVSLAKTSWGVLRQDKELAAIPIASAVTCGVIAAIFGGAAFLSLEHVTNPLPGQNEYNASPLTWAVGIVGLFVIGIVAQFFAAVLVAGANERLEGGNPSLGSAFHKASSRGGSVVGWAVINSTVGIILSAIRERAGFLGVIVTSFIGAAWNVITWLAIPIIIVEGIGPIAAIKRSAQLLKQTWGENLIAQGGLGIIGLLAMLPGVIVFGLVSAVLPLLGIPLLLIYIAIVGSVLAALGSIFRTALYRFAVGLPNGDVFDEQQLARAFKVKGDKTGGTLR
jgi:MFS family permease